MKLCCNIEEHLWSVCYDTNNPDADILKELFDKWTDPEYIDSYIEKNKQLLQTDFFSDYSVEDIKRAIYKEATEFERFITEICLNTINSKKPDLDFYFHDLSDNYVDWPIERKKMYGKKNKSIPPSLLRLYAVKIQPNVYVLTGGVIKLVHEMHETNDTLKELDRLKNAKRELESKGISDIEGLYYLEV